MELQAVVALDCELDIDMEAQPSGYRAADKKLTRFLRTWGGIQAKSAALSKMRSFYSVIAPLSKDSGFTWSDFMHPVERLLSPGLAQELDYSN